MNFPFRTSPAPKAQFVELPIPQGRRYMNRSNGSVWMPVRVVDNNDGQVVVAFEVPTSETWTYRLCTTTGAPSIYPEGKPIYVYLNCFLKEFVQVIEDEFSDFFADEN
jgi:hypothetical protein